MFRIDPTAANFATPHMRELRQTVEAKSRQSQAAAEDMVDFFCTKIAETLTSFMEPESSSQAMLYASQVPQVLGGILASAPFGQELQILLQESFASEDKTSQKLPKSLNSYNKAVDTSKTYVPSEMLNKGVWGC